MPILTSPDLLILSHAEGAPYHQANAWRLELERHGISVAHWVGMTTSNPPPPGSVHGDALFALLREASTVLVVPTRINDIAMVAAGVRRMANRSAPWQAGHAGTPGFSRPVFRHLLDRPAGSPQQDAFGPFVPVGEVLPTLLRHLGREAPPPRASSALAPFEPWVPYIPDTMDPPENLEFRVEWAIARGDAAELDHILATAPEVDRNSVLELLLFCGTETLLHKISAATWDHLLPMGPVAFAQELRQKGLERAAMRRGGLLADQIQQHGTDFFSNTRFGSAWTSVWQNPHHVDLVLRLAPAPAPFGEGQFLPVEFSSLSFWLAGVQHLPPTAFLGEVLRGTPKRAWASWQAQYLLKTFLTSSPA